MKVGLCMWSFTDVHKEAGSKFDPFSAIGLAEAATASGLQAVEVSARELDAQEPHQRQGFVDALAAGGLAVAVDTGAGETPEATGANVERALRTASSVGATVVRTTISRCLEGDRSRYGYDGWKAHLQALVAPMRQASHLAEEVGIPFGIENHQDICSWELAWLAEEVASPWFGVVMDCGNAFAVGEEPATFAARVMPYLKHVHFKDYLVHPSPSGWRFVRCPVGAGAVDFPDLIGRISAGAPGAMGCIEMGSSSARHVRCLEADWWATYDRRPWEANLAAIRALHAAQQPPGQEWRTPHEQGEAASLVAAYELEQLEASVAYLQGIT
jgi:3-oxoisoapionate decarboxylase